MKEERVRRKIRTLVWCTESLGPFGVAWHGQQPLPQALSLSCLSRNSFREPWCFPASQRGDKAVSLVLAASQLTPLTGRFDLGLSRPNPCAACSASTPPPPRSGEKGISEGQFREGQAAPCAQLALKLGCWMQEKVPDFYSAAGRRRGWGMGEPAQLWGGKGSPG